MTVTSMTPPPPAATAQDLRAFRRSRGLTVEALSVLGGVDIATISRIERGLQRARPGTVVRLARGLGVAAKRMQAMCDASCESYEAHP